jgi:sec-independent protein translocase protein TatB
MLPGVGWTELLVLAVLAMIVIGPKDLPRVMRTVGRFVGKARAMAREFQSSFEEIAREAEMEEMRKEAETLRTAMAPVSPPAPLSPDEEEKLIAAHNAKVLEAEAAAMGSPAERRGAEQLEVEQVAAAPLAAGGATPSEGPASGDNVTPIRGTRR